MRKPLVLAVAGAAVLAGSITAPAMAACGVGDICTDTTLAAFTVVGGTISIVATEFAAGAPGGSGSAPTSGFSGGLNTVTVPLGVTTVLDTRLSSSGWTMSATAPLVYDSADTTTDVPGTGSAFWVPADPAAETLSGLGLAVSSFSARTSAPTTVDGDRTTPLLISNSTTPNAAVFTPFLRVTIPGGTATGLYTGTVTQSVS